MGTAVTPRTEACNGLTSPHNSPFLLTSSKKRLLFSAVLGTKNRCPEIAPTGAAIGSLGCLLCYC